MSLLRLVATTPNKPLSAPAMHQAHPPRFRRHACSATPRLPQEIERMQDRIFDRYEISRENILRDMADVVFDPIECLDAKVRSLPLHRMPERARPAVAKASCKNDAFRLVFHNRDKALDMLCKYLGLFDTARQASAVDTRSWFEQFRRSAENKQSDDHQGRTAENKRSDDDKTE